MLCVGAMLVRYFGPRVRQTRFGRCHLGASDKKGTRINVTKYLSISNINSVTNLPIIASKDAVRAACKRHCARVVPLTTREHQGETHPLCGGLVACGATLTQHSIVRSVGDDAAVAIDRCGRWCGRCHLGASDQKLTPMNVN